MNFIRLLSILLVALTFAACASKPKEEVAEKPAIEDQSADEIYTNAQDALTSGRFIEAARLFNEVERLHPYSNVAEDSQLYAAVSYYKDLRYDEAVIALDRYIQLYPGSDNLDYAYYLRALCYYDQITDVRRDQEITTQALENLTLLIRRFPDSEYARDGEYKRDLTLDHLAGKEMEIGRYYLTRGHYQAGIHRFLNVVQEYQTTTHTPEALHRLVEAYLALGIEQEAFRVALVLGHNYPGSDWYADTYELLDPVQRQKMLESRSFVDKTIEGIFRPN
jgi:outer membrane protein assembly factor BamD